MLGAKVEHLLGFGEAADVGAGETTAPRDQSEGGDAQRFFWSADQRDVSVTAEQVNIGVYIVLPAQWRSEWQMPQKRISICTSCSFGSRRGILVEASGDVALVAE